MLFVMIATVFCSIAYKNHANILKIIAISKP